MLEYNAFEYLYPPRPENAIPPELLGFYANQKKLGTPWLAQVKKNGTCSVIAISPEKEIIAWNRHNEPHKAWQPSPASSKAFKALPGKGWYVFAAELLHNKGPQIKDTNYIFDMMVRNGKYLVGVEFQERYQMLKDLFTYVDEDYSHYKVDQNTWVAKVFDKGFRKLYDTVIPNPLDEGVVLKRADAPLEICARESSNQGWSVKCRKPNKLYSN